MDDQTEIIVRRYGVTGLPDWAADCDEELARANRLWNKLVEIERKTHSSIAAVTANNPEVAGLHQKLESLVTRQNGLRDARSQQRRDSRSRRVSDDIRDAMRRVADEIARVREELRKLGRLIRDASKPRLEVIEAERQQRVKQARQESGVYWGTASAIVRGYETARRRVIAKRAQGLPAELKFRPHRNQGRIHNQIPGGYTRELFLGAGTKVALAADGKDSTLTMTAYSVPSREARIVTRTRNGRVETLTTRGPGERRAVTARINAHRDIPDAPGLLVKDVELVLRRNRDWHPLMPERERWLWRECRAIVTATAPVSSMAAYPTGRDVIAVNLGWRNMPDGSVRVATIVSERTRSPQFVTLPAQLLRHTEIIQATQSQRDDWLNSIVPLVRSIPWDTASAPAIAEFGGALSRAPRFGQRALARLTIEWTIAAPTWRPDQLTQLEAWRQRDNRLRSRAEAARRRFFGGRLDLYRVAAARLADCATTILIDRMDVAAMARLPADRDPALEKAVRQSRHVAAPAELKAAIVNAAQKRHRQVIEQPGPSTRICHACNHPLKPDRPAELEYHCDNCRIAPDQDVNNCLVRLAMYRSSGPAAPATPGPLAAG